MHTNDYTLLAGEIVAYKLVCVKSSKANLVILRKQLEFYVLIDTQRCYGSGFAYS